MNFSDRVLSNMLLLIDLRRMKLQEFERAALHELLAEGNTVSEGKAILNELLFQKFNWSSTDRILSSHRVFSETELLDIKDQLSQIVKGVPVQHITGRAQFYGMELKVNGDVLIPRPETEELVQLLANLNPKPKRILDLGTGSGAIALALKKCYPSAYILGLDVSEEALHIARENALEQGLEVHFEQGDMTNTSSLKELEAFDLLVSNPPYIPFSDRSNLSKTVLDYEPNLALFAPEEDTIYFYKAIVDAAQFILIDEGTLAVEIHPPKAKEVAAYCEKRNIEFEIGFDLASRARFIIGKKKA